MSDEINMTVSDTMKILLLLGGNNPGGITVAQKLIEKIDDSMNFNKIIDFMQELIIKNIVGVRLWYIYKNEFKQNIDDLINCELVYFTNEYFYEKFEKYS